jgi:ParB-like chromosome segregation protein Spo0J
MKIERLKVADLSSDPANARKHGDRNIESIIASLRRFGQQKPIVVDSSGCVRAGNGTLEAARRLGWTEIDCVRSSLQSSEITAYAIADNRTAELAEWDEEILAGTLDGLAQMDEDLLAAAGFTEEELAALMDAVNPEFAPGNQDDQGKLDEALPKVVACPHCKTEFDCRDQL